MDTRLAGISALCAAAFALLLPRLAWAQTELPDTPTSAEIWARYRDCESRLKPIEQDEFQRLSPALRAAFLDSHCAGPQEEGAAAPEPEPVKIVAVARFEDRDSSLKNDAVLSTLDTMLWSTFSGRKQSRYRVVRLEPASPGCGLKCALEAATAAGATYLVRGDTQWISDGLLATIEIVSVQTGAQLHARRSEHVLEAGFLVESAAEAISRAADHLFEIEDAQAAAKSAKVSKPIIAVAHLEDAVPGLSDRELLFALDDELYSAIAGLKQPRFRVGRLAQPEGPCHRQCAIDAAKEAGATYVVTSAIERSGADLRITAALVSIANGWAVTDSRSMWVTDPDDLHHAVGQVSRDIVVVMVRASVPAARAASGGWGSDPAASEHALREQRWASPAYAEYRHKRNSGIACFVIGTVLDGIGGGLVGAGAVIGNAPLLIAGSITSGVGGIMFFSGLGVWVANQIKMNKLERGIPLGRTLRLEGLSPFVASRDRGVPGLGARFAF